MAKNEYVQMCQSIYSFEIGEDEPNSWPYWVSGMAVHLIEKGYKLHKELGDFDDSE